MAFAYYEKIARINLTTGTVTVEKLDLDLAKKFIGGRGLGTKIVYDEGCATADALGPDNKLVYITGPLTGAAAIYGNAAMNGAQIAVDEIKNNAKIDDVYVWVDTYSTNVKWGDEVYAVLVDMAGEITEVKIDAEVDADDVVVSWENAGVDGDLAEEGMLVEIEENDDDNNVLVEWANEDDFDIVNIAAETKIKKGDSRFEGKRLNSETKYVMVEGKEDDIEATVKVGGVNITLSEYGYGYAVTEDDEKEVLYVIIVEVDELGETAAAEDLLYVYEVDMYKAGDYYKNEVVFVDGTVTEIKIDNASDIDDATWYTYKTNSDGYYELTEIKNNDIVEITGEAWDNEDGVITDASIDELYKGEITLNNGDYIDIEVSENVVFVDMHDEDDDAQWDKVIRSLDKLWELIDDGKVANVSIELVVDEDDGVTLVVLNHIEPAV